LLSPPFPAPIYVEITSNYQGSCDIYVQDPNRPPPTETFTGEYTLTLGDDQIVLIEAPGGHTPGDIFMYLPEKGVVMVVDVIFPGWVPFRSFAWAGVLHCSLIALYARGMESRCVSGCLEAQAAGVDIHKTISFA
jgi:glyoxylase-like metal-dependent hydrolase (beta-lactamase superfamily II)